MKAVGLFSGGLDSLLAIKLVQEQGIDVIAVSFCSPFFIANEEKKKKLEKTAKENGFKIRFIEFGDDYIDMVRNPKHGHGKNMNPCIDCHAFMLKKAKEIEAKFVFTGEVLDERPMSQNRKSLDIVEEEAGLKGQLLRPLSAKHLPETEAEKKGLINREKLMDIKGRSRKPQIELAKKYNIKEYETPGGGCLLTCREYSIKLKDLFSYNEKTSKQDLLLLRIGRHFRYNENKIIVGRNEQENNQILKLKKEKELVFEAKDIVGPTTLLRGKQTEKAIELAAQLTARYSDAETEPVTIKYGNEKLNKELIVNKIKAEDIEKLRIKWKTKN